MSLLNPTNEEFLARARKSWRKKVVYGWVGVVLSVVFLGAMEYGLVVCARHAHKRLIQTDAALQALKLDSPIAHEMHVRLLGMASIVRTLIEIGLVGTGHVIFFLYAGLMMNAHIAMIISGRRDQRYLAIIDAAAHSPQPPA